MHRLCRSAVRHLPADAAKLRAVMTTAGATDLLIFLLRLALVVSLYLVVAAVLLALRRQLQQPPASLPAQRAGGPGASAMAKEAMLAEGSARLTLIEAAPVDGPPGRVVRLNGSATIGRRPACDVVLRDDSVSGQHARLSYRQHAWQIEDLGSTNGTYVNGHRLRRPATLAAGDVIRIGMAVWRFDAAGADDADDE